MNRPRRSQYRTGSLLLALVGVLAAIGALAGFAVAKSDSHRSEKRHHHGHHHHHHGGKTGTIASFDTETGRLTISLLDGETVSGLVTDRTRIRCEDEHAPDVTQLRRGEPEPGDDRGEEESGDDRGGRDEEPRDDHGEEVGDDHGGDNSGPASSHSGGGPSGHDDNGAGANCTVSDLIVGADVEGAELEIEHGSAFFDEIEVGPSS